jgi:hypothetical protein
MAELWIMLRKQLLRFLLNLIENGHQLVKPYCFPTVSRMLEFENVALNYIYLEF